MSRCQMDGHKGKSDADYCAACVNSWMSDECKVAEQRGAADARRAICKWLVDPRVILPRDGLRELAKDINRKEDGGP